MTEEDNTMRNNVAGVDGWIKFQNANDWVVGHEVRHKYVGKYVIIRSYDSGVHFGILESYNEQTRHVTLQKSRRLWEYSGFTLSAVANDGMANNEPRVAQELAEIIVADVCELIPCTEKAIKNLSEYPVTT